ncbi:MAG: AAA family ATPase, partial [Desulfobacterales bacterium]|nr:AAA family ATPase [Desulfobacterales bacterium]
MLDWIRRKEAIFFVGNEPGIDPAIPDEIRLTSALAQASKLTGSDPNLPTAAEHFELVNDPDSLRDFVATKYIIEQISDFYRTFMEIAPVENILTTRYENAFEIACNEIKRPFQELIDDEDLNDEETEEFQLTLWRLCGSVKSPSSLVLTKEDFGEWRSQNPYIFEELAALLTSKPLVLVGYTFLSARDQFFKNLYEAAFEERPPAQKPPVFFIGKNLTRFMGDWAGKNLSKNHIKMNSPQFMKLLPRALGGAKYSILRAARLPLGNVPDTSDFIGRQMELENLENALLKHKILLIEGMPGVGKTMLAARLAKRVRARFKERVAWIRIAPEKEARGGEKRHIIFDALFKQLAAFFESHGDDSVEAIRTTRGAQLRTKFDVVIDAMRDLTCLIVLDGFESILNMRNEISEKNVKNFINALLDAEYRSRVIFTSRYHPRLNENYKGRYYAKEIRGLNNNEGRDLLRHLQLNADGKTLAHICRKVKGHPLALKIFTTLTEKLPVEEVLQGDYFGKRCSEKLLAKVYATVLSEEEQRLMVDASVFRRPVPLKGIKIYDESLELIERLSNKYLFEFDVDSRNYSQHPIVNDFSYRKLNEKGEKYLKHCHLKAAEFYEKLLRKSDKAATLEVVQNYLERHHHYRKTGDLEKTI